MQRNLSDSDYMMPVPDAIPWLYRTIKTDYDQISRAHFPKIYFPPAGMSFARHGHRCGPGSGSGRSHNSNKYFLLDYACLILGLRA